MSIIAWAARRGEAGHGAAEGGETVGGFTLDERLQTHAHEDGLLPPPDEFPGFGEQGFVDLKRGVHGGEDAVCTAASQTAFHKSG